MFGIGWGAAGLCPGPAFVAAAFGLPSVAVVFLPSVIVGMKVNKGLLYFMAFHFAFAMLFMRSVFIVVDVKVNGQGERTVLIVH